MSLRTRRQLLGLGCYALVFSICLAGMYFGGSGGDDDLAGISALVLVSYVIVQRLSPYPWRIQSWVIHEARCADCGHVIDLVDSWQCGCGYVTWQLRHVFSPCPHCKKVFRWIICPSCEASISL